MELTQSSTMSDIYDEATADSTFLSDRNSRLWDFLSTDGDESSIDHLLTTNLLNERSGGLHSTSSISSCFESDSSISDQSDASYHHINTTQTHVYKPTKSSKFNKFPKNNNTRCWLCDPNHTKLILLAPSIEKHLVKIL